ncbi:MAG: SMP-30/gluconolactonase/LRE family protein [Verrucomicrobiales bacterium]|nr:SMP-30/gluconolactonase/LRE family protein [Verrucomicrobiales bacterium]
MRFPKHPVLLLAVLPLTGIQSIPARGEAWTVAGFVGAGGSYSHRDGPGSEARFRWPTGLAVDGAGRVYVADSSPTVRRVDPDGTVTTIVGMPDQYGDRDGPASQALLNSPRALALDSVGNLFIADEGAHTIRKLSVSGEVTTVAGISGVRGNGNGPALQSSFYLPRGLAVGSDGFLYIADQGNREIRRLDLTGEVSRFAANVGSAPEGLEFDADGNLIAADWSGGFLRRITPAGVVGVLPGTPNPRYADPTDVALGPDGRLYISDTRNECIRVRGSDGQVSTWAGVPKLPGGEDGVPSLARFRGPRGVAFGPDGALWVSDTENNSLRKILPDGTTVTVAGLPVGSRDGIGIEARLNSPNGVGMGDSGELWIADTGNSLLRRVRADGTVTTVAGLAGVAGITDGTGAEALFSSPSGVVVAPDHLVYVTDKGAHTLRRCTLEGQVTTLAGTPRRSGTADGLGSEARFNQPDGILLDRDGTLLVADSGNHCIRRVTPAGEVTTVAGIAGTAGSQDGPRDQALFRQPRRLCLAADGSLYVADTGNATIRRIRSDGEVTTVAGKAGAAGYADGQGSEARFSSPIGITVDSKGRLYVADQGNRCVRQIDPEGKVTTVAGSPGTWGFALGTGDTARFFWLNDVAMDADDRLLISDSGNHVVLRATISEAATPRLEATASGSELRLSWRGGSTSGVVEEAEALATNPTWKPVGGTAALEDGTWVLKLPLPPSTTFFRLQAR